MTETMYSNVIRKRATFNVYDNEDTDRIKVFNAYPNIFDALYQHYRDVAYNEDKLLADYDYREFTYSNNHKSINITMKLKVIFADEFEAAHEVIEETLYYQYILVDNVCRDANLIIETDRCSGDPVISCYDPISARLLATITK